MCLQGAEDPKKKCYPANITLWDMINLTDLLFVLRLTQSPFYILPLLKLWFVYLMSKLMCQ